MYAAERVISPVVYYGGKNMLAPWIVSHFPDHRVYVELFGGGASVLLAKPRTSVEIYNDLEGEVVNFFRMARDRGPELMEALRLTPYARDEFEAVISAAPTVDPVERARRFLVISRQAYGGCGVSDRCLSAGNWKRPSTHESRCSSDVWRNAITGRMNELIDRLQGVGVENRDFEEVILKYDGPDTLFYVDPPYLLSNRSKKHQYRFDFSGGDHQRLAGALANIRGKAIVSYHYVDGIEHLYRGWRVDRRESHNRSVMARNGGRKPRTIEILFFNFRTEKADSDNGLSLQNRGLQPGGGLLPTGAAVESRQTSRVRGSQDVPLGGEQ